MSVDREYKIRISTVTEGAGAQQAAQGLRDTGKAAEEAGEGMKFLETHGREWHRLILEIDRVAPGLGEALRVLFNPATLGITGILFAFEKIKDAFDDWQKKLDDMAAAGAKADFAEGIKAALDVTREAIDAADEYARKRAEIQKGEHGIAVELNNQLQLLAAIQAAQQQQAEAEKTLALAKVKGDEALGAISPTEAIEKRAAIEKQFADRKAADDESNFQKQQAAREAAINKAAAAQSALDQKEQAAADRLKKAKGDQAYAKDAPTIDELRKAQKEAEDAAERAEGFRKGTSAEAIFDWRHPSREAAIKEAEEEERRTADDARLKQAQFNASLRAAKEDTKKLEDDLAAAKKEADDNLTALAKARDEKERAQRERDASAGARGAAESAESQTISTNERTELADRARALQRRYEEVGVSGLTNQEVTELLQGLLANGNAILDHVVNQKAAMQQLKQEQEQLKRRVESIGK